MAWRPFCKLLQRRAIDALGTCSSGDLIALVLLLSIAFVFSAAVGLPLRSAVRVATGRACFAATDNIAGGDFSAQLCSEPFDVVYTWVNGSDPEQRAALLEYRARWDSEAGVLLPTAHVESKSNSSNATDDTAALNRYRDNGELKYSLRSLVKYAPWVRRIILVTNGQVPRWLDTQHPRIRIVTHAEIFPNASDLPTFSSPAIEAHLHRIPGLSARFIYFNDDVMLGSPVWPDSFFTHVGGQKFYGAWEVPKCAPGCVENWLSDGYCDAVCNTTACLWDGGDCVNNTKTRAASYSSGTYDKYKGSRYDASTTTTSTTAAADAEVAALESSRAARSAQWTARCAPDCLDDWLGDWVCDAACQAPECGGDAGDCGAYNLPPLFDGTLVADDVGIMPFWRTAKERALASFHTLREAWLTVESLPCSSSGSQSNSSTSGGATEEGAGVAVGSNATGDVNATAPMCEPELRRVRAPPINFEDSLVAAVRSAVHAHVDRFTYSLSAPTVLSTAVQSVANCDCVVPDSNVTTVCASFLAAGTRIDLSAILDEVRRRAALSAALASFATTCAAQARTGGSANSSDFHAVAFSALNCTESAVLQALKTRAFRDTIAAAPALAVVEAEHEKTPALRLSILRAHARELLLLPRREAIAAAHADAAAASRLAATSMGNNESLDTALSSVAAPPQFPCSPVTSAVGRSNVTACSMGSLSFELRLAFASDVRAANSSNATTNASLTFGAPEWAPPRLELNVVLQSLAVLAEAHPCASVERANATTGNATAAAAAASESESHAVGASPGPVKVKASPAPLIDVASDESPLHRKRGGPRLTGKGRSLLAQEGTLGGAGGARVMSRDATPSLKTLVAAAHADAEADLASFGETHARELVGAAWTLLTARASAHPALRARGRVLTDFYASSLITTNRLISSHFGKKTRKVPAHMPHMIETRAMALLQEKYPDAFAATSTHRFRATTDVQYAFAYFHFLLEGGARVGIDVEGYFKSELDGDGDGVLNDNEMWTLGAIVHRRSPTAVELLELRECLVGVAEPPAVVVQRSKSARGVERVLETRVAHVKLPTWENIVGCALVEGAISKHGRFGPTAQDLGTAAADEVSFEMVGDDFNKTRAVLDGIRAKRPKFICINDDMQNPAEDVQALLNDFYESYVGTPSPFELPPGRSNPFLWIGPLRKHLLATRIKKGAGVSAGVAVCVSIAIALAAVCCCRGAGGGADARLGAAVNAATEGRGRPGSARKGR